MEKAGWMKSGTLNRKQHRPRAQQFRFLMRTAAAQRLGRLNLLRLLQCFFLSHSVSPSLVIEARIWLLPVNAESPGKLAHFFSGCFRSARRLRVAFALPVVDFTQKQRYLPPNSFDSAKVGP